MILFFTRKIPTKFQDENYDKTSRTIDNTDFCKRDSVREEAFYDIVEKCINIYVIIKT